MLNSRNVVTCELTDLQTGPQTPNTAKEPKYILALKNYAQATDKEIATALGTKLDELLALLTRPPNPTMGISNAIKPHKTPIVSLMLDRLIIHKANTKPILGKSCERVIVDFLINCNMQGTYPIFTDATFSFLNLDQNLKLRRAEREAERAFSLFRPLAFSASPPASLTKPTAIVSIKK